MSRKHPGESVEYVMKQSIRENRKRDRVRLLCAKIRYFKERGFNYRELRRTDEGV